jgi:hypothetical protein
VKSITYPSELVLLDQRMRTKQVRLAFAIAFAPSMTARVAVDPQAAVAHVYDAALSRGGRAKHS